jgi:LPS-assembly protein
MLRCFPTIPFVASMIVGLAIRAAAQSAPLTDTTIAERHEVISEKEHHYSGAVELDDGRDTKLYADDVRVYLDQDRAVASGNVVFRQGSSQISADRADFNTKTRLGTFYNATGFAMVQPPRQNARPGGIAPPPIVGQETIVYFIGETVEKIGPRKYKISKGGFTTCVQPTPRWNFSASTIVLNLDHYTLLTQMVMNVKGVPLFYLPVMYYPTRREDRATGFLLPTYGVSSQRGQSLHNAFFWAINRSQDATIMHDWFSKAGQGVGTEYRYNFGGGADGSVRANWLDQHPTDPTSLLTDERSYTVTGSAGQPLPGRLRARGQIDYFSSIATNQTFNLDVNSATRSRRSFGGNVVGAWNSYSLNATLNHVEQFNSQTSSSLNGGWPKVMLIRNERPIGDSPFYVAAGGEYAYLLSELREDNVVVDRNLTRLDFTPRVRFPFKKWQWFTVNTTASWRDTAYSRSYDPVLTDPITGQRTVIVDTNLNRQYFSVDSQITGPVFNRVWDTPDNGYAEKFKHSIEPFLNLTRTSAIDNVDQIIKLEGVDQVVGGDTAYTYGLINRFYAKRRSPVAGQPGQAREIVTVQLTQTYHTKTQASAVDPGYSSGNNGDENNHFLPLALTVRAQPTIEFNATARAEFDSRYKELRQIDVSANYAWSSQLQVTGGWHKRGFIEGLTGFNDPALLNQSFDAISTLRTRDNKYGTIYSFTYDVLRSTMLQQRISAFYNAQCCGLAVEFQNWHYGGGTTPVTTDHRFFMSFTLAGLGNFSPFNGALSGVPR